MSGDEPWLSIEQTHDSTNLTHTFPTTSTKPSNPHCFFKPAKPADCDASHAHCTAEVAIIKPARISSVISNLAPSSLPPLNRAVPCAHRWGLQITGSSTGPQQCACPIRRLQHPCKRRAIRVQGLRWWAAYSRICYDCLGGANARFPPTALRSPTIFWAARSRTARKEGGEVYRTSGSI